MRLPCANLSVIFVKKKLIFIKISIYFNILCFCCKFVNLFNTVFGYENYFFYSCYSDFYQFLIPILGLEIKFAFCYLKLNFENK